MPQTICNGDATVLTIPQAFADLSGSVAGTQLPGGTPTGSGAVVMTSAPTITNLQLAGTLKDSFANSAGSNGQLLSSTATGTKWVTASGTGTVTSVAFAGDGVILSSTPSAAVTSAGNVTATLNTQSPNVVLAGPTSGGSATPTFRAIVAADVPTLNQNTSGTAAGLSGTPAITVNTVQMTGLLTKYNNISTAGNGHPAIIAVYDQSGLVATQTGISLIASLPATAMYRLSGYVKKTTAATTSSTLGPLTITYTNGIDSTSLTPTIAWLTSAGAITTSNATNSSTVTGSNTIVPFTFYGKTGTSVAFTLTYASSGTTAMVYHADLRLEML